MKREEAAKESGRRMCVATTYSKTEVYAEVMVVLLVLKPLMHAFHNLATILCISIEAEKMFKWNNFNCKRHHGHCSYRGRQTAREPQQYNAAYNRKES